MMSPKRTLPLLLEVRLTALKPDRWEWQVCEGEKAIMVGYENSRDSAN